MFIQTFTERYEGLKFKINENMDLYLPIWILCDTPNGFDIAWYTHIHINRVFITLHVFILQA